jgi:hypothetical protein
MGQIEGLCLKTISHDDMMATVNNLGIRVGHKNGKFEIELDGK